MIDILLCMTSARQIVDDFIDQISKNGNNPSEWYTGITTNAIDRLKQHNAENTKWMYQNAD